MWEKIKSIFKKIIIGIGVVLGFIFFFHKKKKPDETVEEQKKTFWNAIKNFFGIKFKLDFGKLSLTDQKFLQYSWLMTQILYQILTSALMTEDGQIQINAEKSLEDVKTTANRLIQAPQF